jgi:hypothetical protein
MPRTIGLVRGPSDFGACDGASNPCSATTQIQKSPKAAMVGVEAQPWDSLPTTGLVGWCPLGIVA